MAEIIEEHTTDTVSLNQQPEVPPRQSTYRVDLVKAALLLISGILLGAAGFASYTILKPSSPITTYEACVSANGSQVTAMYPPTCTTKDGKTFTKSDSNITTNPTPEQEMKTFKNEFFGLTFQYPSFLDVYGSTDGEAVNRVSFIPPCDIGTGTTVTCMVYPKEKDSLQGKGFESAGFFITIKSNLKEQACVSFSDLGRSAGTTRDIHGVTYTTAVTSGVATGHEQQDQLYRTFQESTCLEITLRYTGESGSLRQYTQTDTDISKTFDAMLSSMTFIGSSKPAGFTCPKTDWVDCMPSPNAGIRFECTDEYLQWAKQSCPGFQGAAL